MPAAGEERGAAGVPAAAHGHRQGTAHPGLPHGHAGALLTGIPGTDRQLQGLNKPPLLKLLQGQCRKKKRFVLGTHFSFRLSQCPLPFAIIRFSQ